MQLNLNKQIKDLSGKDVEGATLGAILADHLVQGAEGNPLKFYGWGIKLVAGEAIELDEADKQTVKSFVNESKRMPILIKAQVLQELIDQAK